MFMKKIISITLLLLIFHSTAMAALSDNAYQDLDKRVILIEFLYKNKSFGRLTATIFFNGNRDSMQNYFFEIKENSSFLITAYHAIYHKKYDIENISMNFYTFLNKNDELITINDPAAPLPLTGSILGVSPEKDFCIIQFPDALITKLEQIHNVTLKKAGIEFFGDENYIKKGQDIVLIHFPIAISKNKDSRLVKRNIESIFNDTIILGGVEISYGSSGGPVFSPDKKIIGLQSYTYDLINNRSNSAYIRTFKKSDFISSLALRNKYSNLLINKLPVNFPDGTSPSSFTSPFFKMRTNNYIMMSLLVSTFTTGMAGVIGGLSFGLFYKDQYERLTLSSPQINFTLYTDYQNWGYTIAIISALVAGIPLLLIPIPFIIVNSLFNKNLKLKKYSFECESKNNNLNLMVTLKL